MLSVFLRTKIFRLSQKDFASVAGVAQATVSRWERGLFAPKISTVNQLLTYARAHGIDLRPEDFFDPSRLQKLLAANPPPKRRRGRPRKSEQQKEEGK